MEAHNSEHNELLLNCIDELRQDHSSDFDAICATMQEKHNISSDVTTSLLESLKNSAKIFTVEQKGKVVYMTILPQKPKKLKGQNNCDSKEASLLITKCVKIINQGNDNQGASFDEILNWLQANGGPKVLSGPEGLQKILDREVSYVKLRRNDAGLYILSKKRGRPYGSPSNVPPANRRGSKTPTTPVPKKSPEETNKRTGHLGKRKRVKKNNEDFEFYDTPGNNSMQLLPPPTDPICDFCLKTSSCNRNNEFEELLMCKDCNAKAHASCMGYSETLSRRSRLGPWQCIDCKTCCRCLDSGDPDDLLFCDACDKGYHMFCHDPAIKEKPNNKWACHACISDGVNPDDLVISATPSEDVAGADDISLAQDAVFAEQNGSPQQSQVSVGPVDQPAPLPSPQPSANRIVAPGSSSRPVLPPIPNQWTSTHVSQYIRESGFPVEAQRFYEQEIDGKSLMLLMRQDVLCQLNLKLGPALKIYEKIKTLQKGPSIRNVAH